jgi:hypothetical protein
MFGEAVLLLVCDMLWMKLPKTTSALNHFVALANEGYGSLGTLVDIIQTPQKEEINRNEEVAANTTGNDEHESVQLILTVEQQEPAGKTSTIISKPDVIKLITLYNKADHLVKYNAKSGLICWYRWRAFLQALICFVSFVVNYVCVFCLCDTIRIKCCLNEVFVTKYEHFKCSRPIAPYFQIALVSSLFPLATYFLTSLHVIYRIRNWSMWSHLLPSGKYCDKNTVTVTGDLAFLFSLLEQYDELYSNRFSVFYSQNTKDRLSKMYDIEKNP